MHSSRSSELTVYKVCYGYLQPHHHHWRHHHRRQHNQHDVHQLFQGNLILRIPRMSLSPRHALPYISDWDGLPREDLRWLQKCWTTFITFLFPFVLCLYLLLNDLQWWFITHCFYRRHAPSGCLHRTTDHSGLEVLTKLMVTIICWYTLVCQSFLQASSCIVRLVSTFCLHESGNVISDLLTVFLLMMEMRMTMLVVCNFTVMA